MWGKQTGVKRLEMGSSGRLAAFNEIGWRWCSWIVIDSSDWWQIFCPAERKRQCLQLFQRPADSEGK